MTQARDVRYRACGAADLPALAPVVARVFHEEFDTPADDAFAREAEAASLIYDAHRDLCVAAEADGRAVGVLLVLPGGASGDAAVFTWLAVEGERRGSGIGRELLFRGIEACRERGRNLLRAYAYAVSPAACRLYWLYGFRVAGLEAFPVGGGVRERIVFEKRLDPPATPA
ncbi:MAG TPA: GNAT family N-acetyltransferase [Thermoanaerobaculia bacterium]|nr:GNAT family N-acetyltransferase [Thermoanaerobaculia bacterium]